MKLKKTMSAILAVVMLCLVFFTGCGKTEVLEPVSSIKIVDEETVLQITPETTRKQLYQLLGETYGQQTSGQNGFLATYIIAGKYIYSVSVFNDETSDTPLGYDGQALLNSLKNSKELTTQQKMTVSAKKDLAVKNVKKGFSVDIDYKGKYTVYMNGYPVSKNGKVIEQNQKIKGKNTVTVDVSSALEAAAKAETEAKQTNETTTQQTESVAENRMLGMLEIRNEAEEVVYVEIYLAGDSFISRVRQ